MTVYVDDMAAPYGRGRRKMILCHMIADTDDELHAMAWTIGVRRKWFQGDHYDICKSKRALAVSAGAVEIAWLQCGAMTVLRRRFGGPLCPPEEALDRLRVLRREGPRPGRRQVLAFARTDGDRRGSRAWEVGVNAFPDDWWQGDLGESGLEPVISMALVEMVRRLGGMVEIDRAALQAAARQDIVVRLRPGGDGVLLYLVDKEVAYA